MSDMFFDLQALIDYIQIIYVKITQEWLTQTGEPINLKKICVSDLDVDSSIYKTIINYVQFLNEHCPSMTLDLSSVCSSNVTARVKTQNSIEYKIYNYKTSRHELGKVPLNKCMNDLFGIRIISEIPLTFEQVYAFIEKAYGGKYRCIDSSKGEYKAIHLYFKENNRVFPWELQIWNSVDSRSNFESHKKYKQGYTTWEKESKEGGIIRD